MDRWIDRSASNWHKTCGWWLYMSITQSVL